MHGFSKLVCYIKFSWKYLPAQSSFFGPFVSYKENEVLWIQSQVPYSQHFIFFVTYKWVQLASVLHNIQLEMLAWAQYYNT